MSVIVSQHWPTGMAYRYSFYSLAGYRECPKQSAAYICWEDPRGNLGHFKPYILEYFPVNLWGRNVLAAMGVLIMSPNSVVASQMLIQGFVPNKGLGRHQQGRKFPIQSTPWIGRPGLGYSIDQSFW